MMKQVRMTTLGIEMIMVVIWKNVDMVVPMPVMNMWCAQTTKLMKPRDTTEYTRRRYPQSGFRVLFAITSATMPNAGRSRKAVTSWACTKKGSRQKERPFARIWTMVTMKLIEPNSELVMISTIANSHMVWPMGAMSASGG